MLNLVGTGVAIGAALIGTVVGCEPGVDGGPVRVIVGNHYLMDEYGVFAGDLVHGDRLDLVMLNDGRDVTAPGGMWDRCDHHGGADLIFHPLELGGALAGRYVCEGVDF